MHFVVDGHNLIGHLSQIKLSDPDDEQQLVAMLHRFVLRHPRHHVTVVFDGGVYGHPVPLQRERVDVLFARSPVDADTRLIKMLGQLPHSAGVTLVSADRTITAAAAARGILVRHPTDFGAEIEAPPASHRRSHRYPKRVRPEPRTPRAEVDAWLKLFGVDDEVTP